MGEQRSTGLLRGIAAALGVGAALSGGCALAVADPGTPAPATQDGSARADASTPEPVRPARGPASSSRAGRIPVLAPGPAVATGRRTTNACCAGVEHRAVAARRMPTIPMPPAELDAPARMADPDPTGSTSTGSTSTESDTTGSDTKESGSTEFNTIAAQPVSPTSTPAAAVSAIEIPAAPAGRPSPTSLAQESASPQNPSSAAARLSARAAQPLTVPNIAQPLTVPNIAQPLTVPDVVTTGLVAALGASNVIQSAIILALSVISAVPPGPFTPTPTLRLNGFDLVPTSPEEVTSFYGRWGYVPGFPGLLQGRQTFGVVDPNTGQSVGTFDALVARGNGLGYTQLLVTSTGAPTAAGVPPAGSVISNLRLGPFGVSYSALPNPSGDEVSLRFTTPLGDIRLPIPFNYAKGIADRTADNRPMRLGNGYSIAPVDPAGETITGITGLLPGFMTIQGNQTFGVYDAAGHEVGRFDGVFTTTADLYFYTQAVLVTANDGTNVGPGPGQVPPVGSVYNAVYLGTDDHFLLYSSLPDGNRSDVSVIRVNNGRGSTSALTFIDASRDPGPTTLTGPDGVTFVPVSPFTPSGINGLPPREVEIQGYQRFDVYDPAGVKIGTVDADVYTQWDNLGITSRALLITNVRSGGGDVPPAGSIYNVDDHGRFGSAHATVTWPAANRTSSVLRTPLGVIRLPSTSTPPGGTPVTFYTP